MDDPTSVFLRQLQAQARGVRYHFTRVEFCSAGATAPWRPAINAYRCHEGFTICVDLAGVDRSRIDLRVEPLRVLIRGHRQPPEPPGANGPPLQVLALEIDQGMFERQLVLPAEIAPEGVKAEQRNGLLWIHLPLAGPLSTPHQL